MRPSRALCCVHQADAGSGVFRDAAAQSGYELIEWMVPSQPLPRLEEFDALIVMGGSPDVDEVDRHPWLRGEKALIRGALDQRLPTLGVCLGSQLLAEAGGGTVGRLEVPEIGWKPIRAQPSAAADPVFAGLAQPPTVFQWHRCTFAVPRGAELLADNVVGPQAFRLGQAWGVQFHPEVTAEIVGGWVDAEGRGPEAQAAGVDVVSLRGETESRITASMELGRDLLGRFLSQAAAG